jgi:hypothetical protein
MSFLNDHVLDLALAYIDTATTRLDICSAEPSTFTQATSTFSLGNKTGISVGAPSDASPNGRRVTIAAITDGTVTSAGTASHWALSDTVNSRLIAANSIGAPKAVVTGSPWTLDALDIRIPDPA